MRFFFLVCLFMLAATTAQAEDLIKVRVAYVPGLFNASLAMMINRGWDRENGFELKPIRFQNSGAIIQAMFRGDIDLVIIAPTVIMTANNQGGRFQVLGATMINAAYLYAVGDFAKTLDSNVPPEQTIRSRLQTDKDVNLVYVGPSSAPGVMLHRWLNSYGLNSDVRFITAGADQRNQLIATGAVDMATMWEPFITVLKKKQPNLVKLVDGHEMIKDQPLTGLGGRKGFITQHNNIVQKYLDLHVKATHMLQQDPLIALEDYDATLNKGFVKKDDLKTALQNSKTHFEASPHVILPPTQLSYELLQKYGTFKVKSGVEGLFNTHFYDEAIKKYD